MYFIYVFSFFKQTHLSVTLFRLFSIFFFLLNVFIINKQQIAQATNKDLSTIKAIDLSKFTGGSNY